MNDSSNFISIVFIVIILCQKVHYSDKITRLETGNLVDDFGELIPPDSSTFNWQTYTEVRNVNANSMDLLGVEISGDYTTNNERYSCILCS